MKLPSFTVAQDSTGNPASIRFSAREAWGAFSPKISSSAPSPPKRTSTPYRRRKDSFLMVVRT